MKRLFAFALLALAGCATLSPMDQPPALVWSHGCMVTAAKDAVGNIVMTCPPAPVVHPCTTTATGNLTVTNCF